MDRVDFAKIPPILLQLIRFTLFETNFSKYSNVLQKIEDSLPAKV